MIRSLLALAPREYSKAVTPSEDAMNRIAVYFVRFM